MSVLDSDPDAAVVWFDPDFLLLRFLAELLCPLKREVDEYAL